MTVTRGDQLRSTALSGIRVLEFGNLVAGPLAGLVLADLGAEVIKVERLDGGDEGRSIGPVVGRDGFFFVSCNRNKKSIAVDVSHPAGRDLVASLASKSDVVLDNLRPGVMLKLGLDYASLKTRNSRVISCSIAGYSSFGKYAGWPAYDPVIQAVSGIMMSTGWEGSPPVRISQSVLDIMTGILAATGVLAALQSRERTGEGAEVDVSLLGSSAFLMATDIVRYLGAGMAPVRRGSAGAAVPSDAFETRDGRWVFIATGNERNYSRLCIALGHPELITDERFSAMPVRQQNAETFTKTLAEICRSYSAAELCALLVEARVPCAPVNSMPESLADEDLFAGLVFDLATAEGTIPQVRVPISVRGCEDHIRDSLPPMHGQHTCEVLQQLLHLTDSEVSRLRGQNVIG